MKKADYSNIIEVISFDEDYLELMKYAFYEDQEEFLTLYSDTFNGRVEEALKKIEKVIKEVNKNLFTSVDRLNMIITLINRVDIDDIEKK